MMYHWREYEMHYYTCMLQYTQDGFAPLSRTGCTKLERFFLICYMYIAVEYMLLYTFDDIFVMCCGFFKM